MSRTLYWLRVSAVLMIFFSGPAGQSALFAKSSTGWQANYQAGKTILDRIDKSIFELEPSEGGQYIRIVGNHPKEAERHLQTALAQAAAAKASAESMDEALQKAEALAASGDIKGAKAEWTRVLNFMHAPDWFPTAAAVPICERFAKLADICIFRDMIADADSLMRGAFEFPFHNSHEEKQVDSSADKLVQYYKAHNQSNQRRDFLEFALKNVTGPRSEIYANWLLK